MHRHDTRPRCRGPHTLHWRDGGLAAPGPYHQSAASISRLDRQRSRSTRLHVPRGWAHAAPQPRAPAGGPARAVPSLPTADPGGWAAHTPPRHCPSRRSTGIHGLTCGLSPVGSGVAPQAGVAGTGPVPGEFAWGKAPGSAATVPPGCPLRAPGAVACVGGDLPVPGRCSRETRLPRLLLEPWPSKTGVLVH